MEYAKLATSDGFFNCKEPLAHPCVARFNSIRGRAIAFVRFIKTLIIAPLAFIYKLYKTILFILGVVIGIVALVLTLSSSLVAREFFVRKVTKLAKNLADWVLWPFAFIHCVCRLLLASFVHPGLYFRR